MFSAEKLSGVLPKGYTPSMAKVMISFPDDLLEELDSEVARLGTTRSALLQKATRREIGLGAMNRDEIITRLDQLSSQWSGPVDAGEIIRQERKRD